MKDKIISKSKDLGFELIGFTPYKELEEETEKLEKWLSKSFQADMGYMERNLDKRKDVRKIFEQCESVISLGMNYYVDKEYEEIDKCGKVSRYAWGKDYHLVIWNKLDELIDFIKSIEPKFEAKSYCDTGPVMDKSWAVRSGLGWLGKHSNVINREIGSWFFISNIFTNHNFQDYNPITKDFCGTCSACIDACPTDAIVQDYVVDSNKCISYLTIENKNQISEKFVGKFDDWIFGCDICQDVCPWNVKFAKETDISDFLEIKNQMILFDELENLTVEEFKNRFNDSPILRSKLKGLKRNSDFLIDES